MLTLLSLESSSTRVSSARVMGEMLTLLEIDAAISCEGALIDIVFRGACFPKAKATGVKKKCSRLFCLWLIDNGEIRLRSDNATIRWLMIMTIRLIRLALLFTYISKYAGRLDGREEWSDYYSLLLIFFGERERCTHNEHIHVRLRILIIIPHCTSCTLV